MTHKIDPNVDLEREYVEKTLTRTGIVTEFAYATPKDAVAGSCHRLCPIARLAAFVLAGVQCAATCSIMA